VASDELSNAHSHCSGRSLPEIASRTELVHSRKTTAKLRRLPASVCVRVWTVMRKTVVLRTQKRPAPKRAGLPTVLRNHYFVQVSLTIFTSVTFKSP
jgi:hypothetical protein